MGSGGESVNAGVILRRKRRGLGEADGDEERKEGSGGEKFSDKDGGGERQGLPEERG